MVEADVFLLTDEEPELLAGGDGLTVERSVPASDGLLDDLRSDVGMEWVPEDLWLTHLTLAEDAGDLDYDLSASGGGESRNPSAVDAGLQFANIDRLDDAVRLSVDDGPSTADRVAVVIAIAGAALLLTAGALHLRSSR